MEMCAVKMYLGGREKSRRISILSLVLHSENVNRSECCAIRAMNICSPVHRRYTLLFSDYCYHQALLLSPADHQNYAAGFISEPKKLIDRFLRNAREQLSFNITKIISSKWKQSRVFALPLGILCDM